MGAPLVTRCEAMGPAVVGAFLAGSPSLAHAARLAGLKPEGVQDWFERGRDPQCDADKPYAAFYEACEQAKAGFVASLVRSIKAAGDSDPKLYGAHTWLLERIDPENFTKRYNVQVDGAATKTYAFQEPAVPEPELREATTVENGAPALLEGETPPSSNGNGHEPEKDEGWLG